ncbi:MAG: hypothetical protein A2428_01710 [Bdellovibrionales bacterium RIFOXYC1_FULL_54_43]|nr:MAG: hypothetical protein A2428_01710 [Bdellovibrionales bacterium RIFOXYC1_FULL_54_43]OFZ83650.1 MAG: hypothetical protein A2603_16490 [Bdellovibrionales bacterium RIFOXYD1_FULL_55_31]
MKTAFLRTVFRSCRAIALGILAIASVSSAFLFVLSEEAQIAQSGAPTEHERLRFRNTFKNPEEVIKYYCGRDASGFVWSGLLDVERRAFTLWKELPQHDSFFIAQNYEVLPAKEKDNEALVEVRYLLSGIGDAHGTVMPPAHREHRVTFRLKKDQGAWKIAQPDGSTIAPVVLASKFQYGEANSHTQ